MNSFNRKHLFYAGYAAFSGLGGYRGAKSYNHMYEKEVKNAAQKTPPVAPPQYYYMTCVLYGALGFMYYAVPGTNLLMAIKELYRIEVNIRGIDQDKSDGYYDL